MCGHDTDTIGYLGAQVRKDYRGKESDGFYWKLSLRIVSGSDIESCDFLFSIPMGPQENYMRMLVLNMVMEMAMHRHRRAKVIQTENVFGFGKIVSITMRCSMDVISLPLPFARLRRYRAKASLQFATERKR